MHRFTQWRQQVAMAPDMGAVQEIVRRYVASLGPLVDTLPEACREVLAGDVDVQSAAVILLREELRFRGSEEARELLQELAYTFAAASLRITHLFEQHRHLAVRTAEDRA
jgi:hypothetical protein